MANLIYRPDMDEARARLTTWWNGGDIGRPALQIAVKRDPPWEHIAAQATPPGWITDYSTADFGYRVNLSARACTGADFLGEAVPAVFPGVGLVVVLVLGRGRAGADGEQGGAQQGA